MSEEIPMIGGQTFKDARRSSLARFHMPLQRWVVRLMAPITLVMYAFSAYSDPCWQNNVLLGVVAALVLAWVAALALTKAGRLGASIMTFVISVMAFETTEMILVEGTMLTATLGLVTVTIYASLYSPRFLVYASIGLFISCLAVEGVRLFEPYELKIIPPIERFITQAVFTFVFVPLNMVILRRSQIINNTLLRAMERGNEAQSKILGAVNDLQPVIEAATAQIRQVTSSFAAQASEQAAATAEVNAAVAHVRDIAANSAVKADDTQGLAERTREGSLSSSERLRVVQDGFNQVVQLIEGSREEVTGLAGRAASIEEILVSNQEIGAQIKILAINASIEAAKSGKYGRGFRVVAGELKTLIHRVDENLARSRELLESITTGARESTSTIEQSAAMLRSAFTDLRSTGQEIEQITSNVVATSERIDNIAVAARKQQSSIDEVSAALGQIDTAASQLEQGGTVLLEAVSDIVSSHGDLRTILSETGN